MTILDEQDDIMDKIESPEVLARIDDAYDIEIMAKYHNYYRAVSNDKIHLDKVDMFDNPLNIGDWVINICMDGQSIGRILGRIVKFTKKTSHY